MAQRTTGIILLVFRLWRRLLSTSRLLATLFIRKVWRALTDASSSSGAPSSTSAPGPEINNFPSRLTSDTSAGTSTAVIACSNVPVSAVADFSGRLPVTQLEIGYGEEFRITNRLPTSDIEHEAPPPFDASDIDSDGPTVSPADRQRYSPPNWLEVINPSGQIYFYHPQAQTSTNLNIRDPDIWEDLVEGLVMQADSAKRDPYFGNVTDWGMWQLFVDSSDGSYGATRWTYISHEYRLGIGLGVNPMLWDHRNRQEWLTAHAAYWSFLLVYPTHLSYYPDAMQRAEKDFVTAIVHGYGDRAVFLGDRSTFIYSPASCERLMNAYTFCESHSNFEVVKVTLIARAMYDICHQRIRLKHGTPAAITTADSDPRPHYRLSRQIGEVLLTVLFLGGHRVYVQRLVSVDRWREIGDLTYQENVRNLMESLLQEWSDTNLISAVFLVANMAFLALQSLTGWVETLVLVSTLLALSSLIIGLHHLWKHRVRIDGTWEEAYSFMTRGSGLYVDPLLVLGVVLAAPYIILVWCVLLFTSGLITFCVQSSETPVALGSVAACMLGVVLAVFLVYSKLRPPREMPTLPVGKLLIGVKGWWNRPKPGRSGEVDGRMAYMEQA